MLHKKLAILGLLLVSSWFCGMSASSSSSSSARTMDKPSSAEMAGRPFWAFLLNKTEKPISVALKYDVKLRPKSSMEEILIIVKPDEKLEIPRVVVLKKIRNFCAIHRIDVTFSGSSIKHRISENELWKNNEFTVGPQIGPTVITAKNNSSYAVY